MVNELYTEARPSELDPANEFFAWLQNPRGDVPPTPTEAIRSRLSSFNGLEDIRQLADLLYDLDADDRFAVQVAICFNRPIVKTMDGIQNPYQALARFRQRLRRRAGKTNVGVSLEAVSSSSGEEQEAETIDETSEQFQPVIASNDDQMPATQLSPQPKIEATESMNIAEQHPECAVVEESGKAKLPVIEIDNDEPKAQRTHGGDQQAKSHKKSNQRPPTTQQKTTQSTTLRSVPTVEITDENWSDFANCRKAQPDSLFVRGAEQNKAKKLCAGCAVIDICLAEALENKLEWGVWGGMTERERRALLKRNPNAKWRTVIKEAKATQQAVKVSA